MIFRTEVQTMSEVRQALRAIHALLVSDADADACASEADLAQTQASVASIATQLDSVQHLISKMETLASGQMWQQSLGVQGDDIATEAGDDLAIEGATEWADPVLDIHNPKMVCCLGMDEASGPPIDALGNLSMVNFDPGETGHIVHSQAGVVGTGIRYGYDTYARSDFNTRWWGEGEDFTIATWFKCCDVVGDLTIGFGEDAGDRSPYVVGLIAIMPETPGLSDGYIYLGGSGYAYGEEEGHPGRANDLPLEEGTWHHVVWTRESGVSKCYFDGEQRTLTDSELSAFGYDDPEDPVCLLCTSTYDDIVLDQTVVWKGVALSAAAVAAIYGAGSGAAFGGGAGEVVAAEAGNAILGLMGP
jgi:hypothetical protein